MTRRVMEAVAVEGYRTGALTAAQVERMLSFESRWATDEFLKKSQAYLDYNEKDLEQDQAVLRALGPARP